MLKYLLESLQKVHPALEVPLPLRLKVACTVTVTPVTAVRHRDEGIVVARLEIDDDLPLEPLRLVLPVPAKSEATPRRDLRKGSLQGVPDLREDVAVAPARSRV